MKLAQALKQKNRLAGEITRQQEILRRENARRNDNPSKVDRSAVWNQIENLGTQLAILKGKIAKANVGIYLKLESMAELKSAIAFMATLPKKVGEEIAHFGRDQEKLVYTWDSYITQEMADELTKRYQDRISQLQDEVDAYNATTSFED